MKRINLWSVIFLIILILFRSNILLFFNNIFNLFFDKNNIHEAEIEVLKEKINYLEEEYEKLNSFNKNIGVYADYNYLVSRVIYKENYFYNSKVYIEGGKEDKISKGMAVVNEHGLVGVIESVDENTSELVLLSNTNISVNIRESYGKLIYEDGEFKVVDISKDEDIKLNDEVYTSTLGNIKEKIYVGKVKEVDEDTLEKKIIIESNVDFNNLNYLLVVGDL